MTLLTLPPAAPPPMFDPEDGSVMTFGARHGRNAALTVFEMRGGWRGLYNWSNKTAQNETDFYTKIYTKTIQKDVVVEDRRSIEDVLQAIDGDFSVVDTPVPSASVEANFSLPPRGANFSGIVVGDLDAEYDTVDD